MWYLDDKLRTCCGFQPCRTDSRETNVRVRLTPGKYCIIPSTFMSEQVMSGLIPLFIKLLEGSVAG